MSVERRDKSHFTRSEIIKVTKAKDTGNVNVQTTIVTTDTRDEIPYLTQGDAIRDKDNKKWRERLRFGGFLGIAVATFFCRNCAYYFGI